ncbi:hypothetical protein L2089_15865 [Paenibacillus hunanensis]|uniref:hypothetical protein n=1 Tax=Paenibacillus hunanensis TaxID=539262 RepID=UPI002026BDA7|nr:hypothetical protein [Paenibacillus hunanensis]MCL9662171.1 hypothetical protein [Paenibacillus hunanensis]
MKIEKLILRSAKILVSSGIRVEKCNILIFLLNSPALITFLVLCASIFQCFAIYNQFYENIKQYFSYTLVVLSLFAFTIDLLKTKKKEYEDIKMASSNTISKMRKICDNLHSGTISDFTENYLDELEKDLDDEEAKNLNDIGLSIIPTFIAKKKFINETVDSDLVQIVLAKNKAKV